MPVLSDVYLASASPRRRDILASLGLHVHVLPSGFPEGEIPGASPAETASAHARSKADEIAPRIPSGLVIGADTIVDLDGVAIGKPDNAQEAVETLKRLSGREHLVHTAVVLIDRPNDRQIELLSTTKVLFHTLSASDIIDYVATGESLDKAGAYGIQKHGAALIESITGDYNTVTGFPLGRFIRALPELGYTLPRIKSYDRDPEKTPRHAHDCCSTERRLDQLVFEAQEQKMGYNRS
ncbi:MAG TPA: nucleoside triphosphate pyrophosphatase [Candidatus Baltobacteraceae bacterium]|jgi:septum formation protein|nr:nucleoside triphosphate pyrophosphatase [Candidatus Baltobacteraceae bacterium]